MVRVRLDALHAVAAVIDRPRFDATTEEDIRRHAIEAGEDPNARSTGCRLMPPFAATPERPTGRERAARLTILDRAGEIS